MLQWKKSFIQKRKKNQLKVISAKGIIKRFMVTIQDLYNIVGNKIANEAQKALIRNNFPPQIAEQMCNAIDGQERAEHFQRLLKEYNEWMQNQQRQQKAVQRFLREYYK